MADTWTPGQFNTGQTSGYQYTTAPDGTKYQMLTGGLYMAPDGRKLTADQLTSSAATPTIGPGSLGTMSEWMAKMGSSPPPTNPYTPGVMQTKNRFEAGLGAAEKRLKSLLDDPNSIQQSAAYKFRVGQGQEALQRSLGARGMLGSGNRLMELTKYGQDMGSQEYGNQAGRLSGLLGTYGQGYVADKNANTGVFQAQSGAWNTAEGNRTRNNLGMAGLWSEMNRGGGGGSGGNVPISQGGTRSSWPYGNALGGGSVSGGTDWDAFNRQMAERQASLDRY